MTRWPRLLALLFASVLLFGACSSDDSGGDDAASDDPGAAAGCDTDVCLEGTAFGPDTVTVAAGDTVGWTNLDATDHTVTSDDDGFDSGNLSEGGTFEQTFDEVGDFAYHCEIHPAMTGTITVE